MRLKVNGCGSKANIFPFGQTRARECKEFTTHASANIENGVVGLGKVLKALGILEPCTSFKPKIAWLWPGGTGARRGPTPGSSGM
jgi:hypothetical protein